MSGSCPSIDYLSQISFSLMKSFVGRTLFHQEPTNELKNKTDVMDLYAIQKSFLDMQSDQRDLDTSSDVQQSRNREEMARLSKLINMAIFKGIVPSNRQSMYDVNYDTSDSEEDLTAPLLTPLNSNKHQLSQSRPSSTEFNPNLLLPFGVRGSSSSQTTLNSANHSAGSSRVTLADQFT